MCVEVGRVRVDEARDRLQTKTKHYNMIFSSLIYINTIKLSFRIKKGFCVLVDNSQSECQTRIKRLMSLMLKAPGKKYRKNLLRLLRIITL